MLFDGSGMEFDCVIEKMTRMEADLRIYKERKGVTPDKEIILCQSIIKKDKMEWVAEKATELGVSKIIPILSERSEKKNIDLKRLRKIMIEASEQCGRADVPEVGEIMNLESSIKNYGENAVFLDSSGVSIHKSNFLNLKSIFIGPEGGWSESEIERFKEANLPAGRAGMERLSLGKLTFRSETAAIAALAVLTLPR